MDNNNRRKALGRGLEQLFNNESLYIDNLERDIKENTEKKDIIEINLSDLRSNPYQPRKNFDQEKLNELALSIKEYGVLEPIIVTKSIKGYNLVAGERRKKAAEIVGLDTIPAIVKDFSDKEMMEIALLENAQREDLTPIEEAEAYYNIIKAFNMTQDELAKRVGKSRTYITNMIGLLVLPSSVKEQILNGNISMGHARVLSKLSDAEKAQELCDKIIKENMSVRDLEKLVSEGDFKKPNPIVRVKSANPYKYIENTLREKIGSKVKINNKKIVISFNDEEELERILSILNIDVKDNE